MLIFWEIARNSIKCELPSLNKWEIYRAFFMGMRHYSAGSGGEYENIIIVSCNGPKERMQAARKYY